MGNLNFKSPNDRSIFEQIRIFAREFFLFWTAVLRAEISPIALEAEDETPTFPEDRANKHQTSPTPFFSMRNSLLTPGASSLMPLRSHVTDAPQLPITVYLAGPFVLGGIAGALVAAGVSVGGAFFAQPQTDNTDTANRRMTIFLMTATDS